MGQTLGKGSKIQNGSFLFTKLLAHLCPLANGYSQQVGEESNTYKPVAWVASLAYEEVGSFLPGRNLVETSDACYM